MKDKFLVSSDGGPASGEIVTIVKKFKGSALVQRPDGRAVTVDISRLSHLSAVAVSSR